MEEFNSSIQLHQRLSANDSQSADILKKLAANAADHDRFAVHTLTGFQFWRNVYTLLQSLEPSNKLFWSGVAVCAEAAKQPHTRDFLVRTMDFVPLAAELLLRTHPKSTAAQRLQLHGLFDALATDYATAQDQPVFFALVRHLIKQLYSAGSGAASDQRPIAVLSLSTLVNLCDRNACVMLHLRHQVDLAELTGSLDGFPVLGARMQFLLARTSGGSRDEMRAHWPNLVRMVRQQLGEVSSTTDAAALRHLQQFIEDLCAHREAKTEAGDDDGTAASVADVSAEFGSVLQAVQKAIASAKLKSSADQLNALDALLRLCIAVVRLAADSLASHYNMLINVTMAVLDVQTSASAWAHRALAGTAFDILHICVLNVPSVTSIFCDKLLTLLRERLQTVGQTAATSAADCQQYVALFRLLDTCLDKVPATALDLLAADVFDELWLPLNSRQVNLFQLDAAQLRVHVQSLHLLLRCSYLDADNGQRTEVLRQLFAKRPLHYVVALASQSADGGMQRLVFGLAQCTHFPAAAISEVIGGLRERGGQTATASPQQMMGASPMMATVGGLSVAGNCCTMSAQHSARLQQLLDTVQSAMEQRGGGIGGLSSNHIVDLYRHKLRDAEQRERQLQDSNERTLRTVAELQHARVQQARELSAYDAAVYAAAAAEEVLSGELEILRRERVQMSKATQDLNARLGRVAERGERERAEASQRLQIAQDEIQNFKKQIDTERQKAEADEKRRVRDMREQQKLIDVLKQSLAKYEARTAEQEERVRKATEELAAEKVRCRSALAVKESALKQIEGQLADKCEELERVKAELEADIEIRNSIMQMIQGKKGAAK